MKIFPIRPVSPLDKAMNLIKIMSGVQFPLKKTSVSPNIQVFPRDKYFDEVIHNTGKLTIDKQGKSHYSVDTKELARRMSIRTYFNDFMNHLKGE